MALSRPFLNGTILFSTISPNYESALKEELYGCFKYIGIPFDVLYKMPIRDRKFFINKHNEAEEKSNASNDSHEKSIDGLLIDGYTDQEQKRMANASRR